MTKAASGRSLGKGLAATAGYSAAALLVVAATSVLRRHPLQAASLKAHGVVDTALAGVDLWLSSKAEPPPTLLELLLEELLRHPPAVGAAR